MLEKWSAWVPREVSSSKENCGCKSQQSRGGLGKNRSLPLTVWVSRVGPLPSFLLGFFTSQSRGDNNRIDHVVFTVWVKSDHRRHVGSFPVCLTCSLNALGTAESPHPGLKIVSESQVLLYSGGRNPEYRFHIDFHNWNC